ncbi:phosphodiester glycosidase family protein [Terribacillus saccharophilus]|uniref:phosphodiester glycosidase family protein n=1 Tax=Terribacillus saccharophilus TaxID=361277 RepID=UPI003D273211
MKQPFQIGLICLTLLLSLIILPINLSPSTYDKTKVVFNSYDYNDSVYYVTKIYYRNELGKVSPVQKAYANDGFGRGLEEVLSFSERQHPSVAINASVFNPDRGEAYGIQMKDGEFQKEQNDLGNSWLLGSDQTGKLYTFPSQAADKVMETKNIVNTWQGFFPLVVDGEWKDYYRSYSIPNIRIDNPRQIIMQDYYNNTYIYTFDGRTEKNSGITYTDFYHIIKNKVKNIRVAYVLDGGGSTSLVLDGKAKNDLIGTSKEKAGRKVADYIYFD